MSRINDLVVCGDTNEFYLGKLEQAVSEIKHDWNSDLTGFIDSDKIFAQEYMGPNVLSNQCTRQNKIQPRPNGNIREQVKKH